MAEEEPVQQQNEIENPPTHIISPLGMAYDPDTVEFNPTEYFRMAGDALRNTFSGMPSPEPQGGIPPQAAMPIQPPFSDAAALTHAVDHGYADKKLIPAMTKIRQGAILGDLDMVGEGHKALVDYFEKQRSYGQKVRDRLYNNNAISTRIQEGVNDLVMHELQQPGSTNTPLAEDALRLGLIGPHELQPGRQVNMVVPPTQPVQIPYLTPPAEKPHYEAVPGVRLTPFQEDIVNERQKAISSGLIIKKQNADSLKAIREATGGLKEAQKTEIPYRIKNMQSLDNLRVAQVGLANARSEWYKNLPGLRRELSGTNPIEIEALKRVQQAIREKKPIDKADWFIAQRWLTKGSAIFTPDFMGRLTNRFTGGTAKEGNLRTAPWIPEPPDLEGLTPDEQTEMKESDSDLMHQLGQFFGSLLQGMTGGGEPETKNQGKTPKVPTKPNALGAAEQAELERLRKKYGR